MKVDAEVREARKERLHEFVCALHMTQRGFGMACGKSEQWVNKFTGNPSATTRRVLLDAYPMLNWDWLMNGVGGMFVDDYEQPSIVVHNTNIKGNGSGNNIGGDMNFGPMNEIALQLAQAKAKMEQMQKRIESLERMNSKLLDMLRTDNKSFG